MSFDALFQQVRAASTLVSLSPPFLDLLFFSGDHWRVAAENNRIYRERLPKTLELSDEEALLFC